MTYKFARYNSDANEMTKYNFDTFEEASAWVKEQLAEFLKVNDVKDESKDRMYWNLKGELLSNLEAQKPTEERPGETRISRNIREAKERRERGESPWCL